MYPKRGQAALLFPLPSRKSAEFVAWQPRLETTLNSHWTGLTGCVLRSIPEILRFVSAALYTGWLRPRAFSDCRETTYTDSEAADEAPE